MSPPASVLDGPRIEPRGLRPRALVVLLHGYGADGGDLIALGEQWRAVLPDAAFVSPNAPEQIPGHWGGLQWFSLDLRNPAEYWRGAERARPLLDGFLDAELTRYGLGPDRLALVGFSQGCMMALHTGLRRAVPVAGIVGYSGRLVAPERLAEDIRARPPTLLVHGDDDEVVPVDALHTAREALAGAGVPLEWHVRPGPGHGIDGDGLRLGAEHLARVLA
jgi:phospholipase/carboxylesterase